MVVAEIEVLAECARFKPYHRGRKLWQDENHHFASLVNTQLSLINARDEHVEQILFSFKLVSELPDGPAIWVRLGPDILQREPCCGEPQRAVKIRQLDGRASFDISNEFFANLVSLRDLSLTGS